MVPSRCHKQRLDMTKTELQVALATATEKSGTKTNPAAVARRIGRAATESRSGSVADRCKRLQRNTLHFNGHSVERTSRRAHGSILSAYLCSANLEWSKRRPG